MQWQARCKRLAVRQNGWRLQTRVAQIDGVVQRRAVGFHGVGALFIRAADAGWQQTGWVLAWSARATLGSVRCPTKTLNASLGWRMCKGLSSAELFTIKIGAAPALSTACKADLA